MRFKSINTEQNNCKNNVPALEERQNGRKCILPVIGIRRDGELEALLNLCGLNSKSLRSAFFKCTIVNDSPFESRH